VFIVGKEIARAHHFVIKKDDKARNSRFRRHIELKLYIRSTIPWNHRTIAKSDDRNKHIALKHTLPYK